MSGSMQEQMSRKRDREQQMLETLPGTTRALRIQHYSKNQIPRHFLSETGGLRH